MIRLLVLFVCMVAVQIPVSGVVLTAAIVEQVYSPNPDESRVYVSGLVRKLPESNTGENTTQPVLMTSNLSILGAEPNVDVSGLSPAADVEVRFWQPDQPAVFIKVQTDEQGQYVAGLENGVWMAEACGSSQGFYPAAWSLMIENDKLVSMEAESIKEIRLDSLSPSDLVQAGSVVTLYGQGFGCNGELVFTYSNEVNRCGSSQPVDYAHERIHVKDFVFRSDTQLRFVMPELDADREVMKHIATVQYQQGNVMSQGLLIAEQVSPAAEDYQCLNEQPTAAATVLTDANGQAVIVDAAGTTAADTNSDNTSTTTTTVNAMEIVPVDVGTETSVVTDSFKPVIKRWP